jgi:AraC family transcriptional regulator
MYAKESPNEYKIRINQVINFILQNLSEDLSLEKLAKIADYSPFHFQKIFKSLVGESPKQYVNRVRLETAAHALVIHREKSVTEIAFDHGFSSSATFARSFKNYFGVSSEKFRTASLDERADEYRIADSTSYVSIEAVNVTIERVSGFCGIFVNAKLDDEGAIQTAFRKVVQLAETHDLLTKESKFVGVIYLHSNIYRAMVTTNSNSLIPVKLNTLDIASGKFATLDSYTNPSDRISGLRSFAEFWLPKSGYRIADIVGYEILAENPAQKPFNEIKKKIYIPIKPIS